MIFAGLTKSTTDRLLTASTVVVISSIMFVGFAKNYYLKAWLGTRSISALVHLHGAVMTAWVLLFLTQTFLITKRRSDLHRKLGVFGAVLAAAVVALGVWTIAAAIERRNPGIGAGAFAQIFVAFDGASLLMFGGLVAAALRTRLRPAVHRRLMLMAFVSLLPPAFGRFVAYFTREHVELLVLGLMYSSVLLCVGIDTFRHRRLNLAIAAGGGLIIAVNQVTYLAQVAD